jgi:CHAT domain-containing protein
VVLSGCETALGRQVRGEGLIGLTRAFLYAGARGVQVSLWKVADDATPALMSSFYEFLRQGHGVADAMRLAKLESLADPRRAHPFYWAPFVLIGGGIEECCEGRSAERPS